MRIVSEEIIEFLLKNIKAVAIYPLHIQFSLPIFNFLRNHLNHKDELHPRKNRYMVTTHKVVNKISW